MDNLIKHGMWTVIMILLGVHAVVKFKSKRQDSLECIAVFTSFLRERFKTNIVLIKLYGIDYAIC